MKKLILAVSALIFVCVMLTGCGKKHSIVGKWVDVKTEATFEYTEDGYFYEYANENFTSQKTKYELSNNEIIYYLDGDTPDGDTAWSVPYEFTKDGHLIIAGEIEYRPLIDPRKEKKD